MIDYHNEHDPYAAQWIRNLILAGLIPQGEVDERSITDVCADDLRGFRRWHFFSGIGGWALALRLAGWPDDREICTGSAPCQPFSVAGKGKGTDDSRHLWPDMFRIIRAIRPAVCMGEQVHAAARQGWLDGVLSDLERIGYAGDAISVPACAVNAPHRRDRLWWCAEDRSGTLGHGHGQGLAQRAMQSGDGSAANGAPARQDTATSSDSCELLYPASIGRREGRAGDAVRFWHDAATSGASAQHNPCDDAHAHVSGSSEGRQQRSGEFGGVGSAEGNRDRPAADSQCSRSLPAAHSGVHCGEESPGSRHVEPIRHRGAWDDADWIICHDGKARRVGLAQSRIRGLADDGRLGGSSARLRTGADSEIIPLLAQGIKARVGKLRAFGNMIVPQLAAEVVRAWMECRP